LLIGSDELAPRRYEPGLSQPIDEFGALKSGDARNQSAAWPEHRSGWAFSSRLSQELALNVRSHSGDGSFDPEADRARASLMTNADISGAHTRFVPPTWQRLRNNLGALGGRCSVSISRSPYLPHKQKPRI
jgi:hypothetical protein